MGTTVAGTRDVVGTVREMWETRPLRRDADRKVAGVAGAVARRYRIDPTLVRVAFVVLALTGGGVLLYLAGWIALPADPTDRPRRDRRRGGPPIPVLVLTAIVGLVTVSPAGGRFQSLVGLALAAVLLYALHTSSRASAAPASSDAAPSDAAPSDAAPSDAAPSDAAPSDAAPAASQPPAWDPLGAAPFAWDLPTPAPKPAPPRSRHTPVTLAIALLVAGALGVLGLLGVAGVSVTAVLASALAVVGLGLVVGAFRHRGRGLVVAGVPLVVLTVLSAGGGLPPSASDGPGGPPDGVRDVRAAPAAAALVARDYRSGLGDVDLDLRALTAGAPPVTTTVASGAGDVSVLLPRDAGVRLTCRSGVGTVDCLGRSGDVAGLVDPGVAPPGGPPGPVIDLTVSSGAGDVEVHRG